jgi:Flp pilus assembly protein protease CpaA
MEHPFFPGIAFGWTFYLTLVALTTVAAYQDCRRFVIPKWVTLPTLGLGFLFTVVRLAALGWSGHESRVLLIPVAGLLSGASAGFCFSLVGFLVAFALFFVMYALGTCGGGDLKLFAAVGAWVGPLLTLALLGGTVAVVLLLVLGWAGGRLMIGRGLAGGVKPAYAPAVALSVAVLLLWVWRSELLPTAAGPQATAVLSER